MRIQTLSVAILLGISVAGQAVSANILEGPFVNPENNHTYDLIGGEQTWSDSEAQAESLGGQLVTINDATENQWLVNTFGTGYWIGIFDPDFGDGGQHAADFEWISGEPITYLNWAPGEPNNDLNKQYYGWMEPGTPTVGQWDDNYYDAELDGVVEIPNAPEPASLGLVTVAAVGLLRRNRVN